MKNSQKLAGLVLLITSSIATSAVFASNNVRFLSAKLFESGLPNLIPVGRRYYRSTFPKSTTRYVFIEFRVQNLNRRSRHKFRITARYFHSSGKYMGQHAKVYTMPTHLRIAVGQRGWGAKRPGVWPVGSYTVKLYLNADLVATKYFSITAGGSYQRGNTRHVPGNQRSDPPLPPAPGGANPGNNSTPPPPPPFPGSSKGGGGAFPSPRDTGASGIRKATWHVKNDTPYHLYIRYYRTRYGSSNTKFAQVSPGAAKNIHLESGLYRLQLSTSKRTVRPLSKNFFFRGGRRYQNRYYIHRTRRTNKTRSTPKYRYDRI